MAQRMGLTSVPGQRKLWWILWTLIVGVAITMIVEVIILEYSWSDHMAVEQLKAQPRVNIWKGSESMRSPNRERDEGGARIEGEARERAGARWPLPRIGMMTAWVREWFSWKCCAWKYKGIFMRVVVHVVIVEMIGHGGDCLCDGVYMDDYDSMKVSV